MVSELIRYLLKTSIVLGLSLNVVLLVAFGYLKLKLEPFKAICRSKSRLDGKIALVTGSNQGIGLETARELALRGATVIIACRNENKSAEAIADIIRTTGNNNIEYIYLNLASFVSVRKFVEDFNKSYDRLDILVNNAGCGFLKHKATEDGIDMVMQVNYFGPFLLTNLLLNKLEAASAARIIIVSSWMHNFGRLNLDQLKGLHVSNQLQKYCDSKLCNVLWMKALAKRLPRNVTVNALHPGIIKTDLFKRLHPIFWKWFVVLLNLLNFKTPKEGAQTSIYLAVSEDVADVSGKYFMECVEAGHSRVADNHDLVERVWNESVALTKTMK